jgi:1,4-dihydroxy-6-naphthoate synthase
VRVRLAVSPDADDLAMLAGLLLGEIDPRGDTYALDVHPTDALNRLATDPDPPEVLALSVAHWPIAAARYRLLTCGCSMGEGYGPVVVAREPRALESLEGRPMAVPGLTTTAWLTFRLLTPVRPLPVEIPIAPHERVFDALTRGEVDAALLIHEGRLTFAERGFVPLLELGEAWSAATHGLPLPLGANAIRRDVANTRTIASVLRDSIRWGLEHEERVLDWVLQRGTALRDRAQVARYLAMYANARSLDCGPDGQRAVAELLRRGRAAGLLSEPPPQVEWITPET